jgi:hypothetical protein
LTGHWGFSKGQVQNNFECERISGGSSADEDDKEKFLPMIVKHFQGACN